MALRQHPSPFQAPGLARILFVEVPVRVTGRALNLVMIDAVASACYPAPWQYAACGYVVDGTPSPDECQDAIVVHVEGRQR